MTCHGSTTRPCVHEFQPHPFQNQGIDSIGFAPEVSMSTRRNFFQNAAALSAALFGLSDPLEAQAPPASGGRTHHAHAEDASPGPAVTTPDVPDLPFELDGNVKVFRLTAE